MKKPRSWGEARKHPGISSIDYEAPGSPMSNDDAPWLVTLKEGWSFNEDMTMGRHREPAQHNLLTKGAARPLFHALRFCWWYAILIASAGDGTTSNLK